MSDKNDNIKTDENGFINDEVTISDTMLDDSLTDDNDKAHDVHGVDSISLRTENYLDDDEEFLKSDDKLITEKDTLALFAQDENVISWEVINLLDEDDNLRKKRELRSDPPILAIKSSDGSYVEFILTKGFTKSLLNTLSRVDKAYYGIDSIVKEKVTLKDRWANTVLWMKDNPIKTLLAGALVLFILFAIFVL